MIGVIVCLSQVDPAVVQCYHVMELVVMELVMVDL